MFKNTPLKVLKCYQSTSLKRLPYVISPSRSDQQAGQKQKNQLSVGPSREA